MTATAAAGLIAEQTGARIRVGRDLGGGVGAREVSWGAGGRGVMKVFDGPRERMAGRRGTAVAAALRDRGYPAPALRLAAMTDDAFVAVYDWMPGRVEEVVDHRIVDDALRLVAVQASVRVDWPGESWTDFVLRALSVGLSDDEGFCLHEPLAASGIRTRSILARARAAADALRGATFEQASVAHGDFHHRNLLTTRGRISAVIDWDSARPADPIFDAVTLAFCSVAATRCDEGAVQQLWNFVHAHRPEAVVEAYKCLLGLRLVDWSIRKGTAADVKFWLDAAEAC